MVNFIIIAAVGGYAVFLIARRIKNKKEGKSSCGCGGNCSSCGSCRGCTMSSMSDLYKSPDDVEGGNNASDAK